MQLSELQSLVMSAIAAACNIDSESVSLDADILGLGLDSLVLVSIANQIAVDCRVVLTSEQTLALFEAVSVRDLISKIQTALAQSGTVEEKTAA
jgi:hypothetical protein